MGIGSKQLCGYIGTLFVTDCNGWNPKFQFSHIHTKTQVVFLNLHFCLSFLNLYVFFIRSHRNLWINFTCSWLFILCNKIVKMCVPVLRSYKQTNLVIINFQNIFVITVTYLWFSGSSGSFLCSEQHRSTSFIVSERQFIHVTFLQSGLMGLHVHDFSQKRTSQGPL